MLKLFNLFQSICIAIAFAFAVAPLPTPALNVQTSAKPSIMQSQRYECDPNTVVQIRNYPSGSDGYSVRTPLSDYEKSIMVPSDDWFRQNLEYWLKECGNRYMAISHSSVPLIEYFVFLDDQPFILNPFGNGEAQEKLRQVPRSLENISSKDALPVSEVWRLVSALRIYSNFRNFENNFLYSQSTRIKYQWPAGERPNLAEFQRAHEVANGARIKALRAVMWQLNQMATNDFFDRATCTLWGQAHWSLDKWGGNSNATNDPMLRELNTMSPWFSDAEVRAVHNRVQEKALPDLLARIGRVKNYRDFLYTDGGYTKYISAGLDVEYSCADRRSGDFVISAINGRITDLRNAELAATLQRIEAENIRLANNERNAVRRNQLAASGNVAPVADDIVRAVLLSNVEAGEQYREENSGNFVRLALSSSDEVNYPAGTFVERAPFSTNSQKFEVKDVRCRRTQPTRTEYSCAYALQTVSNITALGVSFPTLRSGWVNQSEVLIFQSGQWKVIGLTERFIRARRARASSPGLVSSGAPEQVCTVQGFGTLEGPTLRDQSGLRC